MKLRNITLLFCLVLFFAASTNAQDYIGAAKCKMCHNKPTSGEQYKKWSEGPHAKAFETLPEADRTNEKCLKCHTTPTLEKSEGVSCEACHGPGSKYKAPAIMKDQAKSIENGLIVPDEALCKKCHNEESPNFKGFDFATYSAKIAHPAK